MRRALRRLIWPAAGAIVLALAAGLAAPHFVSAERLRRAVAIEISAIAGQSVSISGVSRFTLLPWPSVTVENLQIGGEGEAGPTLVEASGLEARLRPLALVMGRVEVSGLELIRPRIVLSIDAQGRSNWRSGASLLSLIVTDPGAGGERTARLGDLTLRQGSISFRDEQARRRTELTEVDVSVSWPSFGSRLAASGRFRLRGEEIRFEGALARPAALFTRDISPMELSFETGAIRAQIAGNALAARDIQIEGRLTFASPSLRRLAGWLAPEAQNAPDVGPVQGTASLKILDRTITLDQARLTVARSRGEGAMSMTFDRTRTSVQGTVDIDTIDLRPFLAVEVAQADLSGERIRTDSLGAIDLDFRISADNLLLGRTTVRNAALAFMSADGRVEASIGDGQVFGGRLSGRIIAERRQGGGLRVRGNMATSAIRTDDALRELFGIIRVAGPGDLSISLAAEGESLRDLFSGVTGEARVRLAEGTLTGIDLGTLVRRAERSPVEALLDARGGRTPIELASASFRILNGAAITDDGLIRGPGYRVTLRGSATLLTNSLNFNGVLSPPPTEATRVLAELPFVIRGPWLDPVIVPNPEGLVRRQVAPGPQTPAPEADPAPEPTPAPSGAQR